MKRYIAESQGDARRFWNVVDSRNSTYVKRLTNRETAQALARELNHGHKIHKGKLIDAWGTMISAKSSIQTKWWTLCNIYGEFRETWKYVTCKTCLKMRFTGIEE